MGSFDTSAFIQAEKANCRSGVEENRDFSDTFAGADKDRNFRHFKAVRAATVEGIETIEGGRVEKLAWPDGLSQLEALPKPSWIDAQQWDELVWECRCIGRDWAETALGFGWSVGDLFGCHPRPSCADGSLNGLAMTMTALISPVRLTDLNADFATLEAMHGHVMRYRPRNRPRQALIWEAAASSPSP